MLLLIVYIVFAVIISALCSLMESVLLSTPQTYINVLNDNIINKVTEKKDSAVSAILIINTIANTIGSALVGIQASTLFDSFGIGVISAVFTILILTCSEIIPKSIGTNNYKKLIRLACIIINKMIIIVYPLVYCVNLITRYFKNEQFISEEEIIGTVETGLENGTLTETETNIIKNVLDFKGIIAEDIMTPRNVVEIGYMNGDKVKHYINAFNGIDGKLTYSRIPVMDYYYQKINGYILKDEIMNDTINPEDNINLHIHNILQYYDNTPVNKILKDMISKKEHISAIIDEFGTFRGIVTLEDIIETILGFEIMDETDDIVDMQAYAKEKMNDNK